MFELLSLAMRYVFVALGGLILIRIVLWFWKDAKEYKKDLSRLPDAGLVGEFRDVTSGKTYPIPREGDMGKGFSCDVRVKGSGVKRHHVQLRFVSGKGLKITPLGGKYMVLNGKRTRSAAYALNGSTLRLGQAEWRVCFFIGVNAPHPAKVMQMDEESQGVPFIPDHAPVPDEWGPDEEPTEYGGLYEPVYDEPFASESDSPFSGFELPADGENGESSELPYYMRKQKAEYTGDGNSENRLYHRRN